MPDRETKRVYDKQDWEDMRNKWEKEAISQGKRGTVMSVSRATKINPSLLQELKKAFGGK